MDIFQQYRLRLCFVCLLEEGSRSVELQCQRVNAFIDSQGQTGVYKRRRTSSGIKKNRGLLRARRVTERPCISGFFLPLIKALERTLNFSICNSSLARFRCGINNGPIPTGALDLTLSCMNKPPNTISLEEESRRPTSILIGKIAVLLKN